MNKRTIKRIEMNCGIFCGYKMKQTIKRITASAINLDAPAFQRTAAIPGNLSDKSSPPP